MDDTTTTGSGSPGAGESAAPATAGPEKISASDTPTAGKRTRRTAKALPVEDEFAILLSQVSACREAGLRMKWMQLHPGNVVALVMPDVKMCKNNHLYLGEECHYCKL